MKLTNLSLDIDRNLESKLQVLQKLWLFMFVYKSQKNSASIYQKPKLKLMKMLKGFVEQLLYLKKVRYTQSNNFYMG